MLGTNLATFPGSQAEGESKVPLMEANLFLGASSNGAKLVGRYGEVAASTNWKDVGGDRVAGWNRSVVNNNTELLPMLVHKRGWHSGTVHLQLPIRNKRKAVSHFRFSRILDVQFNS